ncbi:tripartite tricarboxylate transporter substrate binding protein [Siccirubricoccus sp. G192]|uniref:Bug family tripartite tricarboxylate transporter substrate binding protein n=1 Tax=Siccirubricoccus sp. G192 TaxID=2849651 RepID=UPI001C2B9C46|nr:tripartite tricarboxylate transporter substrate-binding protein [Siccirubricoccus sp. G192]MBV1798257.1 tripartite tricarboxylate transporter substrate binding protein [Siccirubricoccus sp. G192]
MPQDSGPAFGRRSAGALGLAAALGLARTARAQSWPDRPVRLVVPFGAGGAVDTLSRTVANAFPGQTGGQTLVVENRAGAGGTIAGAAVAQARPDGGTLMMADLGANAIAQELMRGLSYDPLRAFQPICHLVNLPLVLVVPAASPAQDVAGLLRMAKEQPEMPYAHPGIGYVGHLAQELMLREAGVRMTPVPYRSGAEVVRSLVANDTTCSFITVSTSLPFVREGKLRALAVAGKAPVAALPGVPVMAATLPGFEAQVWHGIVAPAGLPAEIVAATNRVFNAVLRQPEVRRAVEQVQAGDVVGGTPEEFGAFIRAEAERWVPVIRAAGLRTE